MSHTVLLSYVVSCNNLDPFPSQRRMCHHVFQAPSGKWWWKKKNERHAIECECCLSEIESVIRANEKLVQIKYWNIQQQHSKRLVNRLSAFSWKIYINDEPTSFSMSSLVQMSHNNATQKTCIRKKKLSNPFSLNYLAAAERTNNLFRIFVPFQQKRKNKNKTIEEWAANENFRIFISKYPYNSWFSRNESKEMRWPKKRLVVHCK